MKSSILPSHEFRFLLDSKTNNTLQFLSKNGSKLGTYGHSFLTEWICFYSTTYYILDVLCQKKKKKMPAIQSLVLEMHQTHGKCCYVENRKEEKTT